MRERNWKYNMEENVVTIDKEMAQMRYSLGADSIDKIAREAGAVIKIGRRKLYLVKVLDAYMASLAM